MNMSRPPKAGRRWKDTIIVVFRMVRCLVFGHRGWVKVEPMFRILRWGPMAEAGGYIKRSLKCERCHCLFTWDEAAEAAPAAESEEPNE